MYLNKIYQMDILAICQRELFQLLFELIGNISTKNTRYISALFIFELKIFQPELEHFQQAIFQETKYLKME